MKYTTRQYSGYIVHHFARWESAKVLVDAVLNKDYQLTKTLKESTRSMVHLINHGGQSWVLKEPVEKNRRNWIRFTTLMRKSDALRSCLSMLRLQEMGIETNNPFVVVEKISMAMVVDSWYLCSFVKGNPCSEQDYKDVVETLRKIHRLGYLHGDTHIKNFLKGELGIRVIDSKLSVSWNEVQKDLELAYLEKSVPTVSQYFKTTAFSYKFARFILYGIERNFNFVKKWIRKIFCR